MNMVEELKAWADKWNIPYREGENEIFTTISFISAIDMDAMFCVHKETGHGVWYGGD